MSEPDPQFTDEMAAAKWEEIAPLIEVLIKRIQDPADFVIEEGSELALDDVASNPYHVSHCVRWGLNAGIEHLHAVKTLVIDAKLIHTAADYTLIRGAIENLAAAYWVLHPSDRNQRVIRALRWMAKNYKDQNTAITDHPQAGGAPWAETLPKLLAIGQPLGCTTGQLGAGYSSTEAVTYADGHSDAGYALIAWRICSGFAHGRPWASLGMNDLQKTPSGTEGVWSVTMTSDHRRILAMLLPAMILAQDLLRLLAQRSEPDAQS